LEVEKALYARTQNYHNLIFTEVERIEIRRRYNGTPEGKYTQPEAAW